MSANAKGESAETAAANDDILKSLRQLNSCITLTSVNNKPGSPSESSSAESSDGEGPPDLSQLRGISIQGAGKGADSILNNILGAPKDKDAEKEADSTSHSSWLNEWSKRCLSISFGSKKSQESDSNEEGDSQDSSSCKSNPPDALKNGTPGSSKSNSRDSSVSSESKSAKPSSGSISINGIPLSASISFSSKIPEKLKNTSEEQESGKTNKQSFESLLDKLPPQKNPHQSLNNPPQFQNNPQKPQNNPHSPPIYSSQSQNYPPQSQKVLPQSQKNPPQSQYIPPQFQNNPPLSQNNLPQYQKYPPQSQKYQHQPQNNLPQSQNNPPQSQNNPPKSQKYPLQSQNNPPQFQNDPTSVVKSLSNSGVSISFNQSNLSVNRSPEDLPSKTQLGGESVNANPINAQDASHTLPAKSSETKRTLEALKSLERVTTGPSETTKKLPFIAPIKTNCEFCLQEFDSKLKFEDHLYACIELNCGSPTPISASEPSTRPSFARKKTKAAVNLQCFLCKTFFNSYGSFEAHHREHVTSKVAVVLTRCQTPLSRFENLDRGVRSRSRSRNSSASSTSSAERITVARRSSDSSDQSLKLTLKITNSSKGKRGRKRTVEIVNSIEQPSKSTVEEMIEKQQNLRESSPFQVSHSRVEDPKENDSQSGIQNSRPGSASSSGSGASLSLGLPDTTSPQPSVGQLASQIPTSTSDPNQMAGMETGSRGQLQSFDANTNMNFLENAAAPTDRPSSVYQPQFESFTGDWFNEYDSGSRIAAAMTGNPQDQTTNNPTPGPYDGNMNAGQNSYPNESQNSFGNESQTTYSNEPVLNQCSQYVASDNSQSTDKNSTSPSEGGSGGLFSQAVLGNEAPAAPPQMPQMSDSNRQGSFEQLCLNDSFNQSQNSNISQPNLNDSGYPSYQQNQQAASSNDLLSELAYLNNEQGNPANRNSGLNSDQVFNTQSNTASSQVHQTSTPSDTSFRALATSPQTSPTSPITSGPTPPVANSTSPLQQISQMGQQPNAQMQNPPQSQPPPENVTGPRLTIANNLLATTTESSVPAAPNPSAYSQQPWLNNVNGQQNFTSTYMQNSLNNAMQSAMGNSMRPQIHAPLPPGYKPSPPPRIRGRPPLIGHISRPPMMRGPGRPPALNALSPLMSSGRGSMLPPLQRHPQYGGGRGGQKRNMQNANQSPNKALRREDINVPARQKDNECQIIAVQNRADGIGVISNIQGGSSTGRDERRPTPVTSESTIHLSDSITLSVRSNAGKDSGGRTEKTGEAGVVANLLASRGITVSPAAGEKEANAAGDQRRLPTASDLNLSSAISVHPPTSRDRDGFAVPHPPSSSSRSNNASSAANNNNVERPPRPPTVDLTQDLPLTHATRIQCSQCDRTFANQALLADHAKVHQQQTQSRMQYKCHLCTAGFSSQKGQQHHYQQFHQLHHSAGDLAIPVVDFRNPVNVQKMARLGIRSFLPLNNLQNRGGGGIVGIPVLSLDNLQNAQMNLQQWGVSDVLTLGPPKMLNVPR